MSASKRKDVGAPNTSQLRAALGRRFTDDRDEPAPPPPPSPPQPHTPHTPRRGDAEGMTRVTLYVSEESAASWRQTVNAIYHGLQGAATKHEVMAELVAEAVFRADAVADRLRGRAAGR